jgi:voltage-gated potassium channel
MKRTDETQLKLERSLAAPMFAAAILCLVLLAGALHTHENVQFSHLSTICVWGLAILYPLFLTEIAVHRRLSGRFEKQDWLFALIPPLRLGGRDRATGKTLWLPRIGWTEVDDELRERVAKAFNVPMIVIALMVLPLLVAEHVWEKQIQADPSLSLLMQTGQGLIWLAFTIEFLVMISIVEGKLRYCKDHWIDIAIILLPLIAFLRAVRLGRLVRLQRLTRTYRIRGLLLRAYRALLVVESIDRIVRGAPETRLEKMKVQFREQEVELEKLGDEIAQLEATLAEATEPTKQAA